jgi:hypothetical protein
MHCVVLALALGCSGIARAQGDQPGDSKPASAPSSPQADTKAVAVPDLSHSQIEALVDQLARLQAEVAALRQQLAQTRMEADTATRELNEIRQFMLDHDAYGKDFEQYKSVKAIKEREAQLESARKAREQREADKYQRRRAMEQQREQRDAQQAAATAEEQRLARFRQGGFDHVGQDVFISRMGYQYRVKDVPDRDRVYVPSVWTPTCDVFTTDNLFFFFRPVYRIEYDEEIDYTQMTFSGSVLNASGETRNIGVGIAFFSQAGDQIGGETIEIPLAAPDSPYPFTKTLAMADRSPFYTYRINVLYSEPVAAKPPAAAQP